MEALARLLDDAVPIPGTRQRVGLDPILGLLFPAFGDLVALGLSVYSVWVGVRLGVPKSILARMVLNVAVDFTAGSLPVVGDLTDFLWKANRRNVELVRRHSAGHEPGWDDWAWLLLLLSGLLAVVVATLLLVLFVVGPWMWRLLVS